MTATRPATELRADVLVVGGGLGGVAAAIGALEDGRSVVLSEEFRWLGGQLTSQGVPMDEHTWIESFGATARYRALRDGIRDQFWATFNAFVPGSEGALPDQAESSLSAAS